LPPCPPNCYDDVNHAQCIFIVGSNTAYAHPILFRRIEDAKAANPALKIIFCDPRRTDTAEIADLYLPILPGTDVSLFNGLLHIMLWEGWTDAAYIAAHTTGFETLKATVRDYTPELVSQTCGINKEDLLTAARLFATSAATLSLYCQGLNQSSSGTASTCDFADLLLPATTWGEKTGTVTNSERRISRVRPAVAAPGETRHDCSIAQDFAQRLEKLLPPRHLNGQTLFPYSLTDESAGVEAIWKEHRESTGGRTTRIALSLFTDHRPLACPMARHEPHRHAGPFVWARRRTSAADEPARHDAPPAQRRRLGARHLQARLHRRALASVT
jgi:anaerobic selenocysteine-containing dehydrogenase